MAIGMRLARSDIVLIFLAILASVEWTSIAYSLGLLNMRDVVTIIVGELVVAAIIVTITRILGQKPEPDELARRMAEEKQRLEEKREDEREKHRKLLKHYFDLKPLFSSWSNLADFQTEIAGAGRWHVRDVTYPIAWTQMQGTDNFHLWAFEHIKSGYAKLQGDLERLRMLEFYIYRDTFGITYTLSEELEAVLKTFHDLSRYPTTGTNYYVPSEMLHAVFALDIAIENSVSSPEATDQKSLSFENGKEIVRCNSATLERLLDEISKLRTLHQNELERLKASKEEHTQLILAIKKEMAEIVQEDIEYLECLKGECALCKRFS
jgi:hypothetical protein